MISIDWEKRNCPICKQDSRPDSPEIKSKVQAEYLSFNEVQKYFIGLRTDQIFFSYYRCKNCNLLYCPWYFDDDQLKIMYSNMPDNSIGAHRESLDKTQLHYAKLILKFADIASNYLEIGPDTGLLTLNISRLTSIDSAYLIEPNMSVQKELERNASLIRNVQITNDIEDLNAHKIDLIAGIHVFDHVLDPSKLLLKLESISNKNAKLSLVVHNEKSVISKLLKSKWPPYCLQHPQLFNPESVLYLLRENGWMINHIGKTTNWIDLRNFISNSLKVIGLEPLVIIAKKIIPSSLNIPIKLGNMIVLANKSDKSNNV